MSTLHVRILIVFGLALAAASTFAGTEAAVPKAQAWTGAHIYDGRGRSIHDGTILVQAGRILALGPRDSVSVPEGAVIHDVAGRVIVPGLVDTHSHIGVGTRPAVPAHFDVNESTDPVQGGVRALDAFNPADPGIQMALAGGVTSANVMPGSGNVIGGQTIYVKLRGRTVEEMLIRSPRTLGGLKMANGENPKRLYGSKGKAPATRMKVFALQREEFTKAKEYLRKWEAYREKVSAGNDATRPEVNLSLEPLVEVLQRRRTVHFHSHRADDIRSVLRLKDEFAFDLLLQHGTEAYKVAAELAQRAVPVSLTVLDSPGGKAEATGFTPACGAELARAGVKVVINTDDWITESRFLLRTASLAVRGGLDETNALKALTSNAAEALQLDDRIGSLEPGKDADFVVLSGRPFSAWTRVLETYIEGEKMFDLTNDAQRRYQSGGFALPNPADVPPCPVLAAPEPLPFACELSDGAREPDSKCTEFRVVARQVFTVTGGTLTNAAVHVRDGKIQSIVELGDAQVPVDIPVLTARAVTPGLIDAFTTVPLSGELNIPADQDMDEKSEPNQADLRVLDAFNPQEPLLYYLLADGVTVVHVCPGHLNVLAGRSGVFRTHGSTADRMVVRFPQALVVNLGEIPKRAYPDRRPGTRMGTAGLLRTAFTAAENYREKLRQSKQPGDVDTNLKHEAILEALDGKISTVIVAQRGDDLVTGLRLARDYQLRAVLGLAAEAYLLGSHLREAGVPILLHPTMQRAGGSMETLHSYLGSAALLSDAGIPSAITSGFEDYVPKTRLVRQEAAVAMGHGLGVDRALAAITIYPARILQIDDRFGSLEPGKEADLVLYDGHPFEATTHVTHVVSAGQVAYDGSKPPRFPPGLTAGSRGAEACCLAQ